MLFGIITFPSSINGGMVSVYNLTLVCDCRQSMKVISAAGLRLYFGKLIIIFVWSWARRTNWDLINPIMWLDSNCLFCCTADLILYVFYCFS